VSIAKVRPFLYNAPAQKLRHAILAINNSGILKFWEVTEGIDSTFHLPRPSGHDEVKLRPELSKRLKKAWQIGRIRRASGGCHKFATSGVMYTVSTSNEAVADSSASETHLDIEALFRAHYGRVARIIARVVGDRARSEDLAVEVFLKLWRNHKAQSQNVEGWLYRVAVRAGLDELRRQTRRGHYERMLAWIRPRPPLRRHRRISIPSPKNRRKSAQR
jgi:hypothetical protein